MSIDQFAFTHCPGGQGFDKSKAAGYQIRARSEGAGRFMGELSSIGTHLGAIVHGHAPEAALTAQETWRRNTQKLDAVPAETLRQFPIIWAYQRLDDERFALTRACYLGLTRDSARRTGNFFAHSLVFPPSALAAHGYNPLALQGVAAFGASPEDVQPGVLPSLDSFGHGGRPRCETQCLLQEPFRAQVPSLLSALFNANIPKKPVVLVVPKWSAGAEVVGGLLQLLPTALRSRVSFITYQSDPKWRSTFQSGDAASARLAEHDLIVLCPRGSNDRTPKPGDLPGFQVFNFSTREFSTPEITAYARFASSCLFNKQSALLDRHHQMAVNLECELDPAACDALVALADSTANELRVPADEIARRLRIILPLVERPSQAEAAFWEVASVLGPLSFEQALEPMRANVRDLAQLADRMKMAGGTTLPGPIEEILKFARLFLGGGRAPAAAVMLDCCGSHRKVVLLGLLPAAISASCAAPADRLAQAEILSEGVVAVHGLPANHTVPRVPQLLPPLFKLLAELDLPANARLWRIMEPVLKQILGDDKDPQTLPLVRSLLGLVKPDTCPDAVAMLSERFIQFNRPQGDALFHHLESMARACRHCEKSDNLVAFIDLKTRESFKPELVLALTQARLVEAAWGSRAEDVLYRAYRETRGRVVRNEDRPNPPTRDQKGAQPGVSAPAAAFDDQLLKKDAWRVLCRDFVETLPPWNEQSGQCVDFWLRQGKFNHLDMADKLCEELTPRFQGGEGRQAEPDLTAHLIARQRKSNAVGAGFLGLSAKIINSLPVEPLPDKWRALLSTPRGGLDHATERRLALLALLTEISEAVSSPDWPFACFPANNVVWLETVAALPPEGKKTSEQFLMKCFETVGLSSPADARVFLQATIPLDASTDLEAGSALASRGFNARAGQIAARMAGLLRSRDTYSRAAVVVAFVQYGLASDVETALCGAVAGGVLSEFDREDKPLRRLVEDHLERRFCFPSQDYICRLRVLCRAGEITLPSFAVEPAPKDTLAKSGVLRGIGRLFGKGQ